MDSVVQDKTINSKSLRESANFAFLHKFLLSFGLILILLFISNQTSYAASYSAGDLAPRGAPEGQLNAADLLVLQNFVNNNLVPTNDELLIGDVAPLTGPDGILNAADIVILTRAVFGEITLPPVVIVPEAPTLDVAVSPTNNNPYTVTGTAVPDTEVHLYIDGAQQQTTTSDSGGAFSFQAALIDGVNTIQATAWDGVDESIFSNVLSVEYINNIPRDQGGIISQDAVWTPGATNQPYVINSSLVIASSTRLTLQPGTVLHFPADYTMQVDGELIIQGTAASPVVLTSSRAAPAANDWQGIYIGSTATQVVIDHAEIRYADWGIEFNGVTVADSGACETLCVRNSVIENNKRGGIYVIDASPLIQGNTIQNNSSLSHGIFLDNASHPLINSGNIITGQRFGISISPGSRSLLNNPLPVINGNSVYGNSRYNLYAFNYFDASNVVLNVTGNWWGNTDPVAIEDKIYDFNDVSNYAPHVDYTPYLDAPGG